jgi:hypothetical protein
MDAVTLIENLTLDRRTGRPRRSLRRMWSLDQLSMPRAFFTGPKWKRLCGVEERPIADVLPEAATYHRPGRKLLLFSLEDDVRERVLEELRPGVYAEWTDVRERWC